jgi:hypothetical protein
MNLEKMDLSLYKGDSNNDILINIIYEMVCKKIDIDVIETLPNQVKLAIIVASLIERNDQTYRDFFSRIFDIDIPASDIKKILFEKYLQHEGFQSIIWEVSDNDMNDVFEECDTITKKIAIKHEPNQIMIVAKFYTEKDRLIRMSNDKYKWTVGQQVMNSKWIYDIHIRDTRELEFEDLYSYIKALHAVRWKPVY